jgi:hypothetical protein
MTTAESENVYVFKRDKSISTILVRKSDDAQMYKYADVGLYETTNQDRELDREYLRSVIAEATGRNIRRAPVEDPKIQDLRISAFFEALTDALGEGGIVANCPTPFGFYLDHEIPNYSIVVTRTDEAGTRSFAWIQCPKENDVKHLMRSLSSACYAMAAIEPILGRRAP